MKNGKKFLLIGLSLMLIAISAIANETKVTSQKKMRYQAVPASQATLVQEGQEKNYCPICGMTLPMFYKTNHAAKHNGKNKQYCSLHCTVEDKEINGSKLTHIKVVDNTSLNLIDAKNAFYVVGSNKPGTMAIVSKYAFASKDAAQAFAKENGGKIHSYNEVYAKVAKGMQEEKEMIAKRQKKMQNMGEKLYNKMCKKTDKKFSSVAKAKAYITKNNLCGNMKGKNLQAVGIYLGRR